MKIAAMRPIITPMGTAFEEAMLGVWFRVLRWLRLKSRVCRFLGFVWCRVIKSCCVRHVRVAVYASTVEQNHTYNDGASRQDISKSQKG